MRKHQNIFSCFIFWQTRLKTRRQMGQKVLIPSAFIWFKVFTIIISGIFPLYQKLQGMKIDTAAFKQVFFFQQNCAEFRQERIPFPPQFQRLFRNLQLFLLFFQDGRLGIRLRQYLLTCPCRVGCFVVSDHGILCGTRELAQLVGKLVPFLGSNFSSMAGLVSICWQFSMQVS